MTKQAGNTIDKRFGPDKIAVRHRRSKASQMLTTAKTDFKKAIGLAAKLIINQPRRIKGKCGKSSSRSRFIEARSGRPLRRP
jgi:hypothetical protein